MAPLSSMTYHSPPPLLLIVLLVLLIRHINLRFDIEKLSSCIRDLTDNISDWLSIQHHWARYVPVACYLLIDLHVERYQPQLYFSIRLSTTHQPSMGKLPLFLAHWFTHFEFNSLVIFLSWFNYGSTSISNLVLRDINLTYKRTWGRWWNENKRETVRKCWACAEVPRILRTSGKSGAAREWMTQ